MNCIDLFAGAGGLSEGFYRAGFKFFAHVEMDEAACLTLKTRQAYFYLKRNNKLDIYIDYINGNLSREEFYLEIPDKVFQSVINSEINEETINCIFEQIDRNRRGKNIDIIIGGPPCQAYSIMGRSRDPKGMVEDKRNYLYKEYIKFLIKYSPKLFVFENVLGLLSAQNGVIFNNIKEEFKSAGYNIDYKVLNAKEFGVLEDRKRIILIGWREDINFKYPEFKAIKSKYTIKDLFSDLPFIKSGESLNSYRTECTQCLEYTHIRRKEWNVLTQNISRPNNERDLEIYKLYIKVRNEEGRKLKY
ncbi:MAG: DNA (cytosine-5-)-methyltransferase, partial [Clostridium sp.]|nr:DNA (cytosine-5-)-methyltransferase [Clostridium sp.]